MFCTDEAAGAHIKQHPFSTQLCDFTLTFRVNFVENTADARYAISNNSLKYAQYLKKSTINYLFSRV